MSSPGSNFSLSPLNVYPNSKPTQRFARQEFEVTTLRVLSWKKTNLRAKDQRWHSSTPAKLEYTSTLSLSLFFVAKEVSRLLSRSPFQSFTWSVRKIPELYRRFTKTMLIFCKVYIIPILNRVTLQRTTVHIDAILLSSSSQCIIFWSFLIHFVWGITGKAMPIYQY